MRTPPGDIRLENPAQGTEQRDQRLLNDVVEIGVRGAERTRYHPHGVRPHERQELPGGPGLPGRRGARELVGALLVVGAPEPCALERQGRAAPLPSREASSSLS